eukprot:1841144-Rhodomonas_salina.1
MAKAHAIQHLSTRPRTPYSIFSTRPRTPYSIFSTRPRTPPTASQYQPQESRPGALAGADLSLALRQLGGGSCEAARNVPLAHACDGHGLFPARDPELLPPERALLPLALLALPPPIAHRDAPRMAADDALDRQRGAVVSRARHVLLHHPHLAPLHPHQHLLSHHASL